MKKTKKKWTGSHGAVSVFLSLILIPCLLFTCVFGDISRVELSKMTAVSAADLSLQSLLARYDPDLKEWYGLVASCQNIEEFYDVSEEYFTGMMSAAGLSDASSGLFTEYLKSLKAQPGVNLLQVEPVGQITVGDVSNNSLGQNSALLQKSIVEFMKYRGPIGITGKLIDKWSSTTSDGKTKDDSIVGIKKNKKTSDAKKEYAEKESDLLEALFNSYLAIEVYNDYRKSSGWPDYGKYMQMDNDLQEVYKDLQDAVELVVQYYFTDADTLYPILDPAQNPASFTYKKEDVGKKEKDDDKNDIYCIDKTLLNQLLNNTDTSTVEANISSQISAWDGIDSGTDFNNVVWALQIQDAATYMPGIEQDMKSLLEKRGKLEAAKECQPKPKNDDLPSDWTEQVDGAIEKIDLAYTKYTNYAAAARLLRNQMVEPSNKVHARSYRTNSGKTIADIISNIGTKIGPLENHLEKQIENLDRVINGGKIEHGKVKPLDRLVKKVDSFCVSKEAWAGTMKGSGKTPYQKKEWNEYAGPENDLTKVAIKNITPQSVAELKARLENIKADLETCKAALENFTFDGKKVTDLDQDTIINAVRGQMPTSRSDISKAVNKENSKTYFGALINPTTKDEVKAGIEKTPGKAGNDPDLNKDSPDLYAFMTERFETNQDDIKDTVKKKDAFKKASEKKGKESKEGALKAEKQDDMGESIPAAKVSGAANVTTSVGSLFDILIKVCSGSEGIADLRDNLYVTEYIMDMCSWYTFNSEGKYKLDDNEKAKWGNLQKDEVYSDQSLTNRPINKDLNHAMRGEIEYILYGEDLLQSMKTSFENLLAVRLALDTVSGFCLYYDSTNITAITIDSIANGIFVASQGVVPKAISKVLMIVALATLEASQDVTVLKSGKPLPFYKSDDGQWFFAIPSGTNQGDFPDLDEMSPDSQEDKKDGCYYSDYMYIFLLLGLNNSGVKGPMLQRLGNVIEANMCKGGREGFDLDKARTHFQLDAKLRVKPLMMTLPLVDNTSAQGVTMRESTDWCTYTLHTVRGYS